MFERSLDSGSCLVIDPCSSVHMFGMRFPIDVLYVGSDDRVVRVQEKLEAVENWPAVHPGREVRH